jgi:hypothetical protein
LKSSYLLGKNGWECEIQNRKPEKNPKRENGKFESTPHFVSPRRAAERCIDSDFKFSSFGFCSSFWFLVLDLER